MAVSPPAETSNGFWARLDGRRFHWFRDVERLSACGNRYAATTDGTFADGSPPLMLQCVRCADRARRGTP